AQYVLASAREPFVEDRTQLFHRLELELLAFLARRTRWHVQRHDRQLAEARFDVAPLIVERFPAELREHFVGLAFRVDRDAAVTLLRHRVAIETMMAIGTKTRLGKLRFLRLGFLDAGDIRVLRGQPIEEAFARGRTDAVGVEGDDFHSTELGNRDPGSLKQDRSSCRRRTTV